MLTVSCSCSHCNSSFEGVPGDSVCAACLQKIREKEKERYVEEWLARYPRLDDECLRAILMELWELRVKVGNLSRQPEILG